MITFRESDHTYWDGGKQIPGVTTILKPLYTGDLKFVSADILEYKSALGTAVHKAIELHVCGKLDYSTVVDQVAPYFEGYLKFERESGFLMTDSELRVYSDTYGYAGTCDLAGQLNGRHVLIDAKTTSVLSPAVALQLAAYREAYNERARKEHYDQATRTYALRLLPNDYRLVPYDPANHRQDFATFMGLLHVHHWCAANKKKLEIAA